MSSPERCFAARRNSSWLPASRIADVATGRTRSTPVARQKCAYISSVSSARSTGSGCRSPVASSPAPIRTVSWISTVRFHQPSAELNTTSRNEFEPRSMTASERGVLIRSAALDELDAIAVRVAHEADPRAALAHPVQRLLRLDALLRQRREDAVEVVDGDRDVVVAGA